MAAQRIALALLACCLCSGGAWSATDNGPLEETSCAENNETFYHYDVLPIPQDVTPDF